MSIIEKNIILKGSKGEKNILTLFDSGSTYSCIQENLAKKIANLEPLPEPREFETTEEGRTVKATHRISIDFYLNSDRFSDEFMVLSKLSGNTCPVGRNDRTGVIIGASTMQKWRMKLDFENDEIIYDPRVTKLRII